MKKALFKFFLFLGVLWFYGLTSVYAVTTCNVSKSAYLQNNVDVLENNAKTVQQAIEISKIFPKDVLEIKIIEIEIEESINCHLKKLGQSHAVSDYLIAQFQPYHIYKKDFLTTKSFNYLIPANRYIAFQVFRI